MGQSAQCQGKGILDGRCSSACKWTGDVGSYTIPILFRTGISDCSTTLCLTQLLLILWRTIQDHDTLFVMAECVHFIGIGVLGYKLRSKKSLAGNLLTNP
jgi:hypothetical protein